MSVELLVFFVLSLGALVSGALVILQKNPINSAVSLVVTFLCMSGLYALLNAPFLALIQVMVYAGAIMVLFLFVIMLLNLSDKELGEGKVSVTKVLAALAAGGVLVGLVAAVLTLQGGQVVEVSAQDAGQPVAAVAARLSPGLEAAQAPGRVLVDGVFVEDGAAPLVAGQRVELSGTAFPGLSRHARPPHAEELRRLHLGEQELKEAGLAPLGEEQRAELEGRLAKWERFGSVEAVGGRLYTKWLFPFELIALLLLAAIPGAVIMARRRL
jgi:NADH-quinone oxidoreductase subunit J